MMKKTILSLLFALAILPSFGQNGLLSIVEDKNLKEFGYLKALAHLDSLIEFNLNDDTLYLKRSHIYLQMNEIELWFKDLNKTLSLNPERAEAYYARGYYYEHKQKPEFAIKDYEKALKYVKKDTLKYIILTRRGLNKSHLQDIKGAYADFKDVLKFNPKDIGAISNMSMLLNREKKYEEAITNLELAHKIDPTADYVINNLAFVYSNWGKYEKANEYFNQLLEIQPNDPLGLNNRGYNKLQLNDIKGALQDVNKSIRIFPENAYAYRNRALIYLKQKENEKACVDLQKALELDFTRQYGDEVEKLYKQNCK